MHTHCNVRFLICGVRWASRGLIREPYRGFPSFILILFAFLTFFILMSVVHTTSRLQGFYVDSCRLLFNLGLHYFVYSLTLFGHSHYSLLFCWTRCHGRIVFRACFLFVLYLSEPSFFLVLFLILLLFYLVFWCFIIFWTCRLSLLISVYFWLSQLAYLVIWDSVVKEF